MITLRWLIPLGLLAAVQSSPVPSRTHTFYDLPPKKVIIRDELPSLSSFEYWTENLFPIFSTYVVHDDPNRHGLHDPLLLTGREAHRAAAFLYRKELFFGDIPHARAILNNQELRRLNGLPDHTLSSIRINYEIPETRTIKRSI